MNPRIEQAIREIRREFRPMMLIATFCFGVMMILTGLALLDHESEPSVLGVWTVATGVAAMATTIGILVRPWAWRLGAILLSAPTALCVAIAFVTVAPALGPGRTSTVDSDPEAFAIAIVFECAIWVAFVLVAMIQSDGRSKRLRSNP